MSETSPRSSQSPLNVVIALDGVGGTGILPFSLMAAAKIGGANLKIQRFFWNHGVFMPFHDLLDKEHIERKGAQLAELIDSVDKGHTVQLVAKSGGSLVAVKALELLSVDRVARTILLSPAISPQYDLSRALQAVERNLICYYSPYDRIILGLGTSLFGTSDGVRTTSAGCAGFAIAPESCLYPEQYSKLEQQRWRPEMLKQLHIGMHFGNSATPWLLKNVVPRLRELD
ncbi:MAG: hypothetical protein Q8T09_17705 [Candidatus Melainabacteria bacterium]|nr:hypothetical protein [Candidatus Melainabacteria bacterium]